MRAWTASIGVHLIVLTAFGVVKFSQSETQNCRQPIPMAKVSQIKKLAEAKSIMPKPKVKRPVKSRLTKETAGILPMNRIFDTAKPGALNPVNLSKASGSVGGLSAGGVILPEGIEFFGSKTNKRKVCYVVDCSGSMQGIFSRVRKELAESIEDLQPDQYFYIIFFGGDRLFEFGKGRLVRATEQSKSAAFSFIETIQPAGRTNALAAMERAMRIRGSMGRSPSVVYFLTDGFELTTQDSQWFSQKIADLLRQFAPETKINTIGFWPQGNDRKMLEAIAEQSGGESVFITDIDN